MSDTNNTRMPHMLRLIVIDSDPATRQYVERCQDDVGVRVIGDARDARSGLRLVRGLQPDAVLLEMPPSATEAMEAVRKIREEFPDTGIVVSSFDASPQVILSCIRSGAQEFVSRPVDVAELRKAIDHIRKLVDRSPYSARRRGSTVCVFSGKGGVGATSVAANLGVALAGSGTGRAIVVDLVFQMGDLALMMDHVPRYNLTDAHSEGVLDEEKLRTIITQHRSGVFLLTVAPSPEVAEEITRQHMVELFGTLNTMFDYVIVDVGRHLDDRTVEVLEIADAVILLTTQDVPTVRNVSRYVEILDRLDFDRDKLLLVVNRFHKKARIALDDVEAALGIETFWTIPNDYLPMSLGIDAGVPAVMEAPRSRVAQSFKDLAKRLSDMYTPARETDDLEVTAG